jgi:hypothetical protein
VFLRGTAGLSLGVFASRMAPQVARAAQSETQHGAQLRGMNLPAKNRSAEGRFGVMFKRLPAYAPPDALLIDLGNRMVEDPPTDDFLIQNPPPFAGFTFFGQFIDHDITLDTTPLDLQLADPDARVNFRTARYDLDSVYGATPGQGPWYDPADPVKLLLTPNVHGVPEDLPRGDDGRALIPDPRNDENLIITQLHLAFVKFHNALVDDVRSQGMRPEWVFEAARRLARWHYQWAVIHDFLPAFVGEALVGPAGSVYKEQAGKPPAINLSYYRPTNREDRPFMPIEFAVAAYRFAHSIVRPAYIINDVTLNRGGVAIFGPPGEFNLNGGRPIPPDLVIEWKNILPVDANLPARPPRKIDTKLSPPLLSLPDAAVPLGDLERRLAVRNLRRGKQVGLPSGQQVAKAMRMPVLTNAQLGLDADPGWKGEAPLWFYILREAELPPRHGEVLGPVGARIVAEVFAGLLQRDRNSYLFLDPSWKPAPPIAPAVGAFTLVDLLRFAGAA